VWPFLSIFTHFSSLLQVLPVRRGGAEWPPTLFQSVESGPVPLRDRVWRPLTRIVNDEQSAVSAAVPTVDAAEDDSRWMPELGTLHGGQFWYVISDKGLVGTAQPRLQAHPLLANRTPIMGNGRGGGGSSVRNLYRTSSVVEGKLGFYFCFKYVFLYKWMTPAVVMEVIGGTVITISSLFLRLFLFGELAITTQRDHSCCRLRYVQIKFELIF
jgi:hypothetical protein